MARLSARARVRCVLSLAAVAAVSAAAAAAGVPHAKPVHRILSTASRVTSPAPGEVAYHSEVRDALGSVRHFSYAGKYASHVVSLDTLPQVTAVACDDTAHMVLTLTDARVLEAWQADLVLVGMAETWQCKDKRGNVAPFAREVLGFRDIVLTARDGRVTHVDHPKHIDFARIGEHTTASISLHTELAPPQACFEKLHLKYFTRPAPDAAAVAKHLKQASGVTAGGQRRLCGWLDVACDISNAASAIANAASTVVNTVTNAAESAWDAISSVAEVDASETYSVSLVNWNWDVDANAPTRDAIQLAGDYLTCSQCYAYLGGSINFYLDIDLAAIENVEVSATATAAAALQITLNADASASDSESYTLFPEGGGFQSITSLSFEIGFIPIVIDVSSQLNLQTQLQMESSGYAVSPGFSYERSYTIGVQYSSANGFVPINSQINEFAQLPGSFDLSGGVALLVMPEFVIQFDLWSVWPIQFVLSPYVFAEVTAAGASDNCDEYSGELDVSAGLAAALVVQDPSISLSILGHTLTLSLPGNFPWTTTFDIIPSTPLTAAGTTGCVDLDSDDYRRLQAADAATDSAASTCGAAGCALAPSAWSACRVTCGLGEQTRALHCRTAGGTGRRVPMRLCANSSTALATSQPCEVRCAGHTGGGEFNTRVELPLARRHAVGMRVAASNPRSIVLTAPHAAPALHVFLERIAPAAGGAFSLDGALIAFSSMSQLLDGQVAFTMPTIGVLANPIFSSLRWLPGSTGSASAQCILHLTPFTPLSVSTPATVRAAAAQPTYLLFKLTGSRPAGGFVLDARLPTAAPAAATARVRMFVSRLDAHAWPSMSNYTWSSKLQAGAAGARVTVHEADAAPGEYAILLVSDSGAQVPVEVTASRVDVLPSGVRTIAGGQHAVHFFVVDLNGDANALALHLAQPAAAAAAAAAAAQRVDMFVARATVPYLALTSDGTLACTTCAWSAANVRAVAVEDTDVEVVGGSHADEPAGAHSLLQLKEVLINHAQPNWGSRFVVAIVFQTRTAAAAILSVEPVQCADNAASSQFSLPPGGVQFVTLNGARACSNFVGPHEDGAATGRKQTAVVRLAKRTAGSLLVSLAPASARAPDATVLSLAAGLAALGANVSASSREAHSFAVTQDAPLLWTRAAEETALWRVQAARHAVALLPRAGSGSPAPGADDALLPPVPQTGIAGARTSVPPPPQQQRPPRHLAAVEEEWFTTEAEPSEAASNAADALHYVRSQLEEAVDSMVQEVAADTRARKLADAATDAARATDAAFAPRAVQASDVSSATAAGAHQVVRVSQADASGVWSLTATCTLTALDAAPTTCVQLPASTSAATPDTLVQLDVPARSLVLITAALDARGIDGSAPVRLTLSSSSGGGGADASSVVDSAITTGGHTFRIFNCLFTPAQYFLRAAPDASAPLMQHALVVSTSGVDAHATLCPSYQWRADAWQACNASCGAGEQRRRVVCASDTGAVVPDSVCSTTTRPADVRACDVGACRWETSAWSVCPVVCGRGTQQRAVRCINDVATLAPRNCSTPLPARTQECDAGACGNAARWMAAKWSACSAPCDGGKQTRAVACRRVTTNPRTGAVTTTLALPAECKATAPVPPPSERTCNVHACAHTAYTVMLADSWRLEAAHEVVTPLTAGSHMLFRADGSSVGAHGMCLTAQPVAPTTRKCSVAAHQKTASCLESMRHCVASAVRDARFAAGDSTAYDALASWEHEALPAGKRLPPAACACFAAAQTCLPTRVCGEVTDVVRDRVTQLCAATAQCAALTHPNSSTALCTPPQQPTTTAAAATSLQRPAVRVSVASISSDRQLAAALTVRSPEWYASGVDTQHVYISGVPAAVRTSGALLIDVTAINATVDMRLLATPLNSLPVTLSGTLLNAEGVDAADVRAGGLTLSMHLACGTFSSRLMAGASGANAVVSGLQAVGSSFAGWNRVARPALLAASLQPFAQLSADMQRVDVTLPPLPAFDPSEDELITVVLPASALDFGAQLFVPDAVIRVRATSRVPPVAGSPAPSTAPIACEVSEWSAWSECAAQCGAQSRTRSILRLPSVAAAACPPLTETRPCPDCITDPCAAVVCAATHTCVHGQCVCPEGMTGAACDNPLAPVSSPAPAMPPVTYFYHTTLWSRCTVSCGDAGTQSRDVTCMARTGSDIALQVAEEACAAEGLARPDTQRECNDAPCAERRATLSLLLGLPASSVRANETYHEHVLVELQGEIATLLPWRLERVRVQTVESARADGDRLRVNVTLLPSTPHAARRLQQLVPPALTAEDAVNNLLQLVAQGSQLSATTHLRNVDWTASSFAIVSGEADEVHAASVISSGGSTVSAPVPPPRDDAPNSPLPLPAILGAAVAAVAVVSLIVAAVVLHQRRRRGSALTSVSAVSVANVLTAVPPSVDDVEGAAPYKSASVARTSHAVVRVYSQNPMNDLQALDEGAPSAYAVRMLVREDSVRRVGSGAVAISPLHVAGVPRPPAGKQ